MAITLNKKISLEFFGIVFGGFRSTVSKLMGGAVYDCKCECGQECKYEFVCKFDS